MRYREFLQLEADNYADIVRQLIPLRPYIKDASVTLYDLPTGAQNPPYALYNFLNAFGVCKEVRFQICPHMQDEMSTDHALLMYWMLGSPRISRFEFIEGDVTIFGLIVALYDFARHLTEPLPRPITLHITTSLIHWFIDDDDMEILHSTLPRLYLNPNRTCLFRIYACVHNRYQGVTVDLLPWK